MKIKLILILNILAGTDFIFLNLIVLLHVVKMCCGFCLVDEKLDINDFICAFLLSKLIMISLGKIACYLYVDYEL